MEYLKNHPKIIDFFSPLLNEIKHQRKKEEDYIFTQLNSLGYTKDYVKRNYKDFYIRLFHSPDFNAISKEFYHLDELLFTIDEQIELDFDNCKMTMNYYFRKG